MRTKEAMTDDDRKFESYLKEVRTLFRNFDLEKEYIFSAVKILEASGNEDLMSVNYQININFADYPRKIQGQMNKLKAVLDKSKFAEIVNFDPNYVVSIGEEFDNFKARKLNVSGVETELSMRAKKIIYVGKIEVNIRIAEFLDRQFQEAVPNLERYMDGEGVYYNYIVYPTHQVKPFKICFKCGRKELDPANPAYFFCRRYTFTVCYDCGVVEAKKRQEPKLCPPYKVYLYFKWMGKDTNPEADTWLQIMPQEDYVPMLREPKHNITCSICDIPNFVGIRYKCAVCENLDACEKCFNKCFDLDKKKGFESIDRFKEKGCEGPKQHVFLAIYFNQAY